MISQCRDRVIYYQYSVCGAQRTLRGTASPNRPTPTPESVLDSYHRPHNIENSLRMSKRDFAARPIYHRKRGSIETA